MILKGISHQWLSEYFVVLGTQQSRVRTIPRHGEIVQRRCKASVKKFERSPTVLAEWIELKETLVKFQTERGNETSDDKGSDDMTSNAKRKRKSK